MKWKEIDKRFYITEIFLVFLFVLNTVIMQSGGYVKIDEFVYLVVNKIPSSFETFFYIISEIGGTTFLPLIALVVCIVLYCKKHKLQSVCLASNLLTSSVLNTFLKLVIRRPRNPFPRFGVETGFSYPSGHSVNNFVFYTLLIFFINKDIKGKVKYLLSVFLGVYIFLVMLSRLYFRYHYFSDIVGAVLEGLTILNFNYIFLKNKENYEKVCLK